jgi:2-methylcitrate dehydratase
VPLEDLGLRHEVLSNRGTEPCAIDGHDEYCHQITEIKVEVIARAADILGDPAKYRPTSKETADHSLPYSLAVGLVDGMVTPLQFEQSRIDDQSLHAVMDKIKVVPNDEFESLFPKFQPSQVTITLTDGMSHVERVDVPKGDPRDPMTEDEIAVKFNALGIGVVGEAACHSLRNLIMNIENEETLVSLFDLMTAKQTA